MTGSVVKQDPNTQKVKNNAIYYGKAQHGNFQGISFFKATLQPELKGENELQDTYLLLAELFSFVLKKQHNSRADRQTDIIIIIDR